MKFLNKRGTALVCAGLGVAGAVTAVTFGATSAQFTSAAATQDNSITAGTITLTANDASASQALTIPTLNPGDSYCSDGCGGTPTGHGGDYQLYYAGTSPAFVGLDFDLSSTAAKACTTANGATTSIPASQTSVDPATVVADCTGGVGTLPLFDGDSAAVNLLANEGNATGEQIPLLTDSVLDNAATCSTNASSVVTCTSVVNDIEVAQTSWFWNNTPFNGEQWVNTPGNNVNLHLQVSLPSSAGNEFQGSGADVKLTGHAVQWNNNVGALASSANNVANGGSLATCASTAVVPSNTSTLTSSIISLPSTATIHGGGAYSDAGNSFCPLSWS